MSEEHLKAPLATFAGRRPPAPDWFGDALRVEPERGFVEVEGARIETLAWGKRGKPGLLLMHGSGAHADWWSPLAPFFAKDYRVAALSWSGMGASDWRDGYRLETFEQEALATARACGLYDDGGHPVIVGHSFGGRIAIALGARHADRIKAAIIVDPPVFAPETIAEREKTRGPRRMHPHRVYSSFEAAMARFRFMPMQPCGELYYADFIARGSLQPASREEDGGEGWTWRFDPFLWKNFHLENPKPMIRDIGCPAALIRGGRSKLMGAIDADYMMSLMPPGSPRIDIPDADHHVMADQPLAFVAALRGLLAAWPRG